LVNDPPLILADEPTGNLDSAASGEVMDILTQLHREGRTIVLVTHDNTVAGYARREITLHDGVTQSDVRVMARADQSALHQAVS
jgi:ABC-type lipoprotein export system ATPase subunit